MFDRPAGSERDIAVLAHVLDATIVQRHPAGSVRVVGRFGVLRWEGLTLAPRTTGEQLERLPRRPGPAHGDPAVLLAMLRFAVHDLGSLGIGALLIYRPDAEPGPFVEERLPLAAASADSQGLSSGADPPRPRPGRRRRHLRRRGRAPPSRRAARAEHLFRRDGRGPRGYPAHVGSALQLRRPLLHRDRRQRRRSRLGAPQRRCARALARPTLTQVRRLTATEPRRGIIAA